MFLYKVKEHTNKLLGYQKLSEILEAGLFGRLTL